MTTVVTLELVKGLGSYEGDTASAEQPREVINLLNINGFALALDGWIPNFAQVKDDGLYADSPIADGRQLLAHAKDTVSETMQLVASAATYQTRRILERQLARFAENARNFHSEYGQIEPVYLKAQFAGAPGPQYALIYNIQLAQSQDPFVASNFNQLTITIEREPFWRAVPPGYNPKVWSLEFNDQLPYSVSDLQLIQTGAPAQNKHLVYDTINNSFELTGATISKRNYVDIAGSLIPGDAPALALVIAIPVSSSSLSRRMVARSTKPTILEAGSVDNYQLYSMAAIYAAMGTDSSLTVDTGGILGSDGVTRWRGEVSFATNANNASRFRWNGNLINGASSLRFGMNSNRGRFAAFARCRQHTGATGDIKIQLGYGYRQPDTLFTPQVNVPVQSGTGNTTEWEVVYLGQITLPPDVRAIHKVDGLGLNAPDGSTSGNEDITIGLWAQRTTGTSVFYFCDLLLLPIDEPMIEIRPTVASSAVNTLIDSTGYFNRATSDIFSALLFDNPADFYDAEWRGQPLTLLPGVNNRLYFFAINNSNGRSPTQENWSIWIDIIPRWYGVRDV